MQHTWHMNNDIIRVATVPVLEPIHLATALVLNIIDKKQASKIINSLQKQVPLSQIGLDHIKQIKKEKSSDQLYCLLCPIPDDTTDITSFLTQVKNEPQNYQEWHAKILDFLTTSNIINSEHMNIINDKSFALQLSQVPSICPRTHEEWTELNAKIWPLKPTKLPLNVLLFDTKSNNPTKDTNPNYITNLKLTKQEVIDAEKYMKMAWEEAIQAQNKYGNIVPVGAIIVRAQQDEIIARAFDQSPSAMSPYVQSFTQDVSKKLLERQHPLHHATMLCIQQVADTDLALFVKNDTKQEEGTHKRKKISCDESQDLKSLPYVCTGT
jgi:tRNA(Arg) A34 adenosine deaminase TadA